MGTSFTWLVDLQANTNFNAALKDNTGIQAFSGQASIVAGSDSRYVIKILERHCLTHYLLSSCVNTAVIDNGSGSGSATAGGSSSAAK
jgi:hypothetical protein